MTKLMQLLTADMGIATTPVGAYLDPSTALPLYLELARAHGCLHDAVRTPQLCVFFDATEIYGRRKCQVLSVQLSQARQPHQLLLQLPLAKYLDQDDHITTSSQFERMDLLPALEKALQSGWGGESMELNFSPDYAAYYRPQGGLHQQQIAVMWSAMVQKNSGSTLIGYGSLCGIFTTTLHAALPSFAS